MHLRCATSEHANFGKGTFVTREYANLAVLAGACSFDAARQLVDAAKQVSIDQSEKSPNRVTRA